MPARGSAEPVGQTISGLSGSPSQDDSLLRITFSIETRTIPYFNEIDTLVLSLDTHGELIAGFTLKVGLLSEQLSIVHVVPGNLIDSCNWEYFTAAPLAGHQVEDGVSRVAIWRVTALAKSSADSLQADCLTLPGKRPVAKIVVATAAGAEVTDSMIPLFFVWEDCRDNALSDASGSTLYLSKSVLDFLPTDSLWNRGMFPTRFGTPASCYDKARINRPRRVVQFQNGGLKIQEARSHPKSGQ